MNVAAVAPLNVSLTVSPTQVERNTTVVVLSPCRLKYMISNTCGKYLDGWWGDNYRGTTMQGRVN